MSFQQILDELIERVPEALAANFNDRDGEVIATRSVHIPADAMQMLAAYQTMVQRQLIKSVEGFDESNLEHVIFATGQHWVLMMGCAEECVLVLVMRRDGLLGRARFEAMRAAKLLNAELL